MSISVSNISKRFGSFTALATVELTRDGGGAGGEGGRLEITVFRDYLRQLGIQEGDRVRLKQKRMRVFPADTATPLLAA